MMGPKAFILAAGEGRRMLPLTEHCPKPLLRVNGKCLIEHHIEKLVAAGFCDIVINVSYLGDMVVKHLGDGAKYGARIQFSHETVPLETGGGLLKALPLIGDDPFLLVNGDVWTDYPFSSLLTRREIFTKVAENGAYLFLVQNPVHNPEGDFVFTSDVAVAGDLIALKGNTQQAENTSTYTFSGLSVINPKLIESYPHKREKFALLEVFKHAIESRKLWGEIFSGQWVDVGTPERLEQVNQLV